MNTFGVLLLCSLVSAVLSYSDEYWITPCGHVYRKSGHPLRIIRDAETLIRLKHHFKHAHDYVTANADLGILEEMPHDEQKDSYVVQRSTLDMYNNVRDVRRLLSVLPMTYRTLQDLAFSLKIVHEELTRKEDSELKKKHVAVTQLMEKNALLLCELDFAMNRNNVEFSRIDQLTLSQEVMTDYKDNTFTLIKHSHILKEYRTFIKHVSSQILRII